MTALAELGTRWGRLRPGGRRWWRRQPPRRRRPSAAPPQPLRRRVVRRCRSQHLTSAWPLWGPPVRPWGGGGPRSFGGRSSLVLHHVTGRRARTTRGTNSGRVVARAGLRLEANIKRPPRLCVRHACLCRARILMRENRREARRGGFGGDRPGGVLVQARSAMNKDERGATLRQTSKTHILLDNLAP